MWTDNVIVSIEEASYLIIDGNFFSLFILGRKINCSLAYFYTYFLMPKIFDNDASIYMQSEVYILIWN